MARPSGGLAFQTLAGCAHPLPREPLGHLKCRRHLQHSANDGGGDQHTDDSG